MKLWVDDIRNPPTNDWVVARTVSTAIHAIAQFGVSVKEISLDHDISHQVSIGTKLERPFPCDETFTPVAWFIAFYYKNATIPAPRITIHTSNPDGAQKMRSIILSQLPDISMGVKPMGMANRLEMEL